MRFIRKLKWVVFGLCLAAALTACKGQKTAVEKKATDAAESAETEEPSGSEDSSDAETGETAESEEEPESVPAEEAPEEPAPEGPTLLKMFRTAMQPVGQTMYVWGGGWNETDDGAGEDAGKISLMSRDRTTTSTIPGTRSTTGWTAPATLAGSCTIHLKKKTAMTAM